MLRVAYYHDASMRISSISNALPEFYVDGTTIPFVNFDIGPSWSGLIPISSSANETRKVWLYLHERVLVGLICVAVVLLVLPSGSRRKSR